MLMLPIPECWGYAPCRIHAAEVDDDWIRLTLADGRLLRLPTAFSTPLLLASPAERRAWRVSSTGRTVRWPSLGVVLGVRRPIERRRSTAQPWRRPGS